MNISIKKIMRAAKEPKLSWEKLKNFIFGRFEKQYSWSNASADTFKHKNYQSYEEYLSHQSLKLEKIKERMIGYDQEYRDLLRLRLAEDGLELAGKNVLCLAARLGTEVKAFMDLGSFSVGIDLNPGETNKYVVTGDFHDLQFPESSTDFVFCNSLDHAYDLKKLLSEVKKVLKPDGRLILEIVKGTKEGGTVGYWEALGWDRVEEVIGEIKAAGFQSVHQMEFDKPWIGVHVVFSQTD